MTAEQEFMRLGLPLIDHEESIILATGQERWLLSTRVPLRDDEGRVIGLVGIARDITQRKQAEESLRLYNLRLTMLHEIDQAVLASQPLAAIAATALRCLQPVMPGWRGSVALFDAATGEAEVLATSTARATAWRAGRRFTPGELWAATLSRGEVRAVEDLLSVPDLSPLLQELRDDGLCSFVAVPLHDAGQMIGLFMLGQDQPGTCTDEQLAVAREVADQLAIAIQQRHLQEQVQEHTIELEAQVAVRTRELQAANAHLRELDELKSRFISNVSHELRTPLANIILYLSLLEIGKPEKRAKYMQTLNREASLLKRLIEDLLQLSRLDQGKVTVAQQPVDINALVTPLTMDRAMMFAERGLALHVHSEPGLPLVQADPQILTQVLTNLMTNAMNYTPAGGTVTVTTALQPADSSAPCADGNQPTAPEQPSRWVTLSVIDTGPGVTAEDQAHLFERFYRGEAGRRSSAPGTGLGLSICRELVERHGGKITVASQPGAGSTFTMWLPA
jgi:signal transduction histidine kinase